MLNNFKNGVFLCSLVLTMPMAGWADECVPQGVDSPDIAVELPALFPSSIPLPEGHTLMSASAGAADDYNPFPFAMVELMVSGGKYAVFDYYQHALAAAGYRIVMWERDEGATGLRIRGEGIDQASFSFNDYDCQAWVSISVSLLP